MFVLWRVSANRLIHRVFVQESCRKNDIDQVFQHAVHLAGSKHL